MTTVISVENVSKAYQLGVVGSGTLWGDLERWLARLSGKPDPFQKIGQEDLGHQIGQTIWAIDDVSFEVRRGERIGIIGHNGAGKSTLLKILSRVTGPTSGKIRARGRIASLLEVGTGFHPELTGRENIFMNGAILGMARYEIERKLDSIADFSGVTRYIDTPVKRYSSGMYVRLAFAVASHLDPEILIVDEVLAVGDAEYQNKCVNRMEDLSLKEGRTILFVSHNLPAIQRLCGKAILLHRGKMREMGETDNIIKMYLDQLATTLRSQQFFEENPTSSFSLLVAQLVDSQGKLILGPIDFSCRPFVKMHIRVNSNISQFYSQYTIYDSKGEAILLSEVRDSGADFFSFKPGVYDLKAPIPNPLLVPGKYRIMIKLQNIDNQERIVQRDCLVFEIEDLTANRGVERPGVVFLPVSWESNANP